MQTAEAAREAYQQASAVRATARATVVQRARELVDDSMPHAMERLREAVADMRAAEAATQRALEAWGLALAVQPQAQATGLEVRL